ADERADVEVIDTLCGASVHEVVRLPEPLAPDTAARRAGVNLPTIAEHAARIRGLCAGAATVIVEGAGGLLVRLDLEGGTLLDLAEELRAEVYVVTRAGLGTLNHTELTVDALRARGIEPVGLIVGSWPARPGTAEICNLEDLPRLTGVPIAAVLPEGAGTREAPAFVAEAISWFTSPRAGSG
ncbi:MAG TPA: dethiobiotin synthase, partial [Nocardioides sp.]